MTSSHAFFLLASICALMLSASDPALAQQSGVLPPLGGTAPAGTTPTAKAPTSAGTAQAPATAAPAVTLPSTASEHEALAKKYTIEAAQYRQTAAEHKQMAAEYKKAVPDPKSGPKNSWYKKMAKHCEALSKDWEKLAADAAKAAEYHTFYARELHAG